MRTLHNIRVAGVTYEGRQEYLSRLTGEEPVRLVPEPENQYDNNAIAVYIATKDGVKHCGYIPKELAAQIAPVMDNEAFIAQTAQFSQLDQMTKMVSLMEKSVALQESAQTKTTEADKTAVA